MAVPTQQQIDFSASPLTGSDMLDEIKAIMSSMVAFREGSSAPSDAKEGEWWADDSTSPYVDIKRRMADGSDLTLFRVNKTDETLTLMNMTDLPVADGGTGASTASGARSNLGVVVGTAIGEFAAYKDDGAGDPVLEIPTKSKTISSATTLVALDHGKTILLDYSGGSFDVTLPSHSTGLQFTFLVIDATNSGDILDSGSSTVKTMAYADQRLSIVSANSAWKRLEDYAETTIQGNGEFSGADIRLTRNNGIVVLQAPSQISDSVESGIVESNDNILPVGFRAAHDAINMADIDEYCSYSTSINDYFQRIRVTKRDYNGDLYWTNTSYNLFCIYKTND